MQKLKNKINNFIDTKINNNMSIFILVCSSATICRLSVPISFILYGLGYHIVSRKFEVLEEKIKLLEFEKKNMLLSLSDGDEDLKKYLENN